MFTAILIAVYTEILNCQFEQSSKDKSGSEYHESIFENLKPLLNLLIFEENMITLALD